MQRCLQTQTTAACLAFNCCSQQFCCFWSLLIWCQVNSNLYSAIIGCNLSGSCHRKYIGRDSPSARSSTSYRRCAPRCNVRRYPDCCYNPVCLKKRRECNWTRCLRFNWKFVAKRWWAAEAAVETVGRCRLGYCRQRLLVCAGLGSPCCRPASLLMSPSGRFTFNSVTLRRKAKDWQKKDINRYAVKDLVQENPCGFRLFAAHHYNLH